jgi:Ca-activated chloride channel family protein
MLEELGLFTQGTNIAAAIEAFNNIIVKEYKLDQSGVNLVILLSDGGKEEALATDRIKLLNIVKNLGSKNFKFFTVGVGGKEAAPLIERDNKGNFINYVKDDLGKAAYSKLDEEILEGVAKAGKGRYFNFQVKDELVGFLDGVIKENRTAGGIDISYKKYYLQAWLFAFAAVLLFFANILNRRV